MTSIFFPLYFITVSVNNFVFPLKNYTGELYCHIFYYCMLYALVVYQYHSFFISLFRYICVVHGSLLMSHGISIKVNFMILSDLGLTPECARNWDYSLFRYLYLYSITRDFLANPSDQF